VYLSKVVPNFSIASPWGELVTAVIVLVVSGIAAGVVSNNLTNQYLPKEKNELFLF
jgi:hypothetical protein